MATGNITKRAVDAATPGPGTTFLWDQEVKGFGLKITPAGGRSYVYQYRAGGRGAKVQRCTIGAHGPWTPDQARKEAKRLAVLIDQGTDPAAENKLKHREAIDLAFPAYAERFIDTYLKAEWKGGYKLASGILRQHVVPALKSKTIKNVGRADISALMDKLAASPATRRNAFAVLRRMFSWAVNRGDLEGSPIRANLKTLGWVIGSAPSFMAKEAGAFASAPAIADRLWVRWTGGRAQLKGLTIRLAIRDAAFERGVAVSRLDSGDNAPARRALDRRQPQQGHVSA